MHTDFGSKYILLGFDMYDDDNLSEYRVSY
jgi:hypothetical protein